MTQHASIVTVTLNPCIDKSCNVDRVVPEHKLRCSQPVREPGGGGINVSRAVAKLGGAATAYWSCGAPTGGLLADLLDAEGVSHHPVEVSEPTRENLIVYEDATGQQYRFGMPGAPLSDADLGRWSATIAELTPGYLVLSGSLPANAPEDLYGRFAAAMPASTQVVVDTSGTALRRAAESGRASILKPNLRELGQLVGREVASDQAITAACRELLDTGVGAVVVSLGGGGAVLVDRNQSLTVRAPVVPIRSKVGAGDSTVAGLVLALSRGWSMAEAVRFGVAAGAAAVMTPGTELCRPGDAEALYEQIREA